MSRTSADTDNPRAVIHKRILELAESRPDASVEELARDVSGASETLVERVLERYGDPAREDEQGTASEQEKAHDGSSEDEDHDERTEGTDGERIEDPDEEQTEEPDERTEDDRTDETDEPTKKTDDGRTEETDDEPATEDPESETDETQREPPSVRELEDRQLETLRAIHERPTASQREIGETLEVSGSAVSQRLRDVDGFEWDDRRAFVERLFEGGDDGPVEDGGSERIDGNESESVDDDNGPVEDDEPESVDGDDEEPIEDDKNEPGEADESTSVDLQPRPPVATDTKPESDETGAPEPPRASTDGNGSLAARVTQLENRIGEMQSNERSVLEDPDLVHKVVHACLQSDAINEEEELRIIDALLD